MTDAKVRVGIFGASGYTGAELARLLVDHPRAELVGVASQRFAGQPFSNVWPSLPDHDLIVDDEAQAADLFVQRGVSTVFLALPHGEAAARVPVLLAKGLRVVDLSADFRLLDANAYVNKYSFMHPAPQLLSQAVYGLTEWCGPELFKAQLVANPGCYATAILLSLMPLVKAGLVGQGPVIINAVSGVSGAGRAPKQNTHFVECDASVSPYKVGESHQHLAEIAQCLKTQGTVPGLVFNPHLVPMPRGILASIVVPMKAPVTQDAAQALYTQTYDNTPFVRVLAQGKLPETRFVRGSNRCDIAVQPALDGSHLLVFAAIDNLLKGAAGQALQNFNRMHDWADDLGLPRAAWGV